MKRNAIATFAVIGVGAFLGGLAAEAFLGGIIGDAQAADARNVVRAEAFVLVDAQGREWARLGLPTEGAAALTVLDADGRARVEVGALAEPAGYGVNAYDAEGRMRTAVAHWDDDVSGIRTFDAEGVKRVGLGAGNSGCGLSMVNANGVQRLGAGVGPYGGGDFTLHDHEGEVIWRSSWTMGVTKGSE
ncbi:MAG: hypothetical protein PVJ27_07280 [Candidatus Brocadiaceae bacterium]